ncbi:MAG: aminotransferase class I/II-fold pyridoxal phosphate-dependent enzyme, partial [Acidobacteria bacterium]
MFSQRTRWSLQPNRLTERLAMRRRMGRPILDLTESNPTRCRIALPTEETLEAWRAPENLVYEPSPKGLPAAREAVAAFYAEKGVNIHPERIVLTASTSEAYSFLFRLLTDPGDAILVPRPSYPLFEFLAALNDVQLSP